MKSKAAFQLERSRTSPYIGLFVATLLSFIFGSCMMNNSSQANNESVMKNENLAPVIYVALGDSTGAGVGACEGGYPVRLLTRIERERPASSLINLCVSGATTDDVLRGQVESAIAAKPTLVTLGIGINDLRNLSVEKFARNYEEIVTRITTKTNAAVVVSNLPDISYAPVVPLFLRDESHRRIILFNEQVHAIAESHHILVADAYTATHDVLGTHPEFFSADGFHPSDTGYEFWAKTMWPVVKSAIEKNESEKTINSHTIKKTFMPASAEQEQLPSSAARANQRASSVERAYTFADLSAYPFKKRLLIRVADLAFYALINFIGRTVRFEVEGWENHEAVTERGGLPIYNFWHERIFLTTYWWRRRKIVVMTSQSFDGEYIARFIQRFGYGATRGSSTRGGVGAVVEMVRLMRAGCTTAFTIDGPKGPPRVAKLGSVLLAKKSGQPVLPVTMALARYWTVPSWDSFQIPKPFTRARVYVAPPIYVPADADDAMLETKRDELQRSLDDLNRRGDEWRADRLR